MKRLAYAFLLTALMSACNTVVLDPPAVDLLIDDIVFTTASDLPSVRIGLYSAARSIGSPTVQAGDFTADNIIHLGTFTDYRELGTKQITPSNGVVGALWGSVFRSIYLANFVLERLPTIASVRAADAKALTAEAKFLRGYANFIGAHTFGGIPKVTSTTLATNRTIPRASKEEILTWALEDFQAALADLPDGDPQDRNVFAGYATKNAARAALARYYLYQKNWAQAEAYATLLINSTNYSLVSYNDVVTKDFTQESIFEFGYTLNDYSGDINNYFVGRREVVPSNQVVVSLLSRESGNRSQTLEFDFTKQKGNDNGWTLRKYGTADESNRNFVIFRLGEMYLIRAEARAQQGKITGTTGAIADINRLRTRAGDGLADSAKPPLITTATQSEMLSIIERERVYELSFEGHRWYDLVRTGRAQAVMSAFSTNWNVKYELWPIPQTEIQRNPSLAGQQNPGY